MTETIRCATTPEDYAAFAGLVSAYVAWCRARYPDNAWFVEQVFGHQGLAEELEVLATSYGPPNGRTFLALRNDEICGAGAYRQLADGTCEMKRLFVPPRSSGAGIGRRLCGALIDSAREEGFSLMRLDTGNLLTHAIALYTSLGFTTCAPYRAYPAELMPYLVFMERRL